MRAFFVPGIRIKQIILKEKQIFVQSKSDSYTAESRLFYMKFKENKTGGISTWV